MLVSINGVIQKPNTGTGQPSEGFALDGANIVFSSPPASGADYFIITIGASVSIGTPSDNTVTSAKIVDGAIVNADVNASAAIAGSKLADDSISLAKLEHGTSSNNGKFLRANNGADPSFETLDLTALSASNLTSGTVPDARFPATLPAASAANLTSIPAGNLTGTVADARISALTASKLTGALPAIDGSSLTGVSSQKADGCVTENSQTISNNYTMTTNKSGLSAGDITVASGVTVTIPSGSRYVII